MENKIKKIIIILLILIAICIILIAILSKRNRSNPTDFSMDSYGIEDYIQIEDSNKIMYEQNKNIYYTVVSVINKYIDESSMNNKDKVLNMLDSEYVKDNNININNIEEITGILPLNNNFQYYVYVPTAMYSMDEGKITTHFIYGYYYNNANMNKKELNLMVELDSINQTFNIYNYNYMLNNGYNNLRIGEIYNTKLENIKNRSDNTFTYISINDEEMADKYLENFKEFVLYDRNTAYQMLNKEYSNLKFKNQEEFNVFLDNKKVEFFTAELKNYAVKTNENGNEEYICRDQNNNYYYFKQTDGIMRYEIVLDNYVLPDEEFKTQYNNAETNEKVALNIEKFIQAINDKSYYYAYNCLADSYKNNYFKTQEEFENYVKQNFYPNSSVEYKQFEIQNDVYTYSVILTNKATKEEMNKTFIMKLGEGTDFVLSFDR